MKLLPNFIFLMTLLAFKTVVSQCSFSISVNVPGVSCTGSSNTLTASGAATYTWSSNAGGVISASAVVNPIVTTVYTVSGTSGTCTATYPVTLNVTALPNATVTAVGSPTTCGVPVTLTANVGAVDIWTQKAGLNVARMRAVSFSIGSKGYTGTGYDNSVYNDFWEYNPTTNAWTQKANFGGVARYGAVGFSIGTKGYIGTGRSGTSVSLNDFWEYDPLANAWTQKSNFGGTARYLATGFSIGTKGYLGSGYNTSDMSDFWEYDPALDSWSQKASMSFGRSQACGFGLNGKGYIVSGDMGGVYLNDLWEYNTATNAWLAKANMGTLGRYGAAAFTLGNKAYVTGGTTTNDLWEYTPSVDAWQKRAAYTGPYRWNLTAFGIGNKGYIGTGLGPSGFLADLWEYDPILTYIWSNNSVQTSITTASSGTYSFTVTNASGCSATLSQSIMVAPAPTISVSGNSLICAGQPNSRTLTVSGATNYMWSTNAGGVSTSFVLVSPNVTTIYTVTGTVGPCSLDYPVTVSVIALPNATLTALGSTATCGAPVTLSANVGTTDTWTQKQSFGNTRMAGFAFTIGSKGYVGTGFNNNFYNDFWEYDPATNAWTQKANFTSITRYGAVGFSIGNKGFAGTGYSSASVYLKDFWEYDPIANLWTQKGDFGGVARLFSSGFVIGTKGYVGCGDNGAELSDFWEYNPALDSWTQKTSMAQSRAHAFSFSIGSKGYIGTGVAASTIYNDLWEYDPSTNAWTSKANLGTVTRYGAAAFTLGNKAYVSGGLAANDFWEYTPATNTWLQKGSFGGPARRDLLAFSINNKGYMGTGEWSSTFYNDLWEYDPVSTYIWATGSNQPSITVASSGTYSLVVSNVPGCSTTLSQNVTIGALPVMSVSGNTVICNGQTNSNTLTASGAASYTWSANAGGANTASITVNPTTTTVYTVTGSSGFCSSDYSVRVTVVSYPAATLITVGSPTSCGIAITLSANVGASNIWTQKQSLTMGRTVAISFNIGSKGYLGTGYDGSYHNDFWEYDPATNAWTQKANFTSVARYGAVGFSIGNKGYAGTGINSSSQYLNDFWEYNPATNVWTQKSNFGGTPRYFASAFSIGTKGYVGVGDDGVNKSDFWEYDPALDTWTQKTSLSITRQQAYSFSSGGKGYIGSGAVGSTYFNDLWEYNPGTNTWASKASMGTILRYGAAAFTLGDKAYVTGGSNTNDFWEYTPSLNTWIQKGTFGGSARWNLTAFSVDGKGYVGTGNGSTYLGDIWEFDPVSTYSWSTSSLQPSIAPVTSGTYSLLVSNPLGCLTILSQSLLVAPIPTLLIAGNAALCAGQSTTLTASGASTYSWNNSATTGSISVAPVLNTTYSVTGTSTAGCSSSTNIAVVSNSVPVITIASSSTLVCSGAPVSFTAEGASTYTWSNTSNNVSILINPIASSVYTVNGKNSAGCTSSQTVAVSTLSLPAISVNPSSATVCAHNSVSFTASGAGTYTWSNSGGIAAVASYTPSGNSVYTVTGTDAVNGCANSITVAAVTLSLPVLSVSGATAVCSGQSATFTASGANAYLWNTGSSNSTLSVAAITSSFFTVVGTAANACKDSVTFQLQVNATPTLAVSGASLICPGRSSTLTASGAASYTWNVNVTSMSVVVSPALATTYSVTGATIAGCQNTATYTVSLANAPVLGISGNTLICAGAPATLNVSGATNYTWSTTANTSSISVSPASSTIYTVSGIISGSPLGCSSTTQIGVSVNPLPVISAISSSNTVCEGEQVTLTATGANAYFWSNGGVSGTISINPTSANNSFTVTGTDGNGCSSSYVLTQLVDLCTFLNEKIKMTGILIYPNPSSGSFIIEVPAGLKNCRAELVDNCGRIVLSEDLSSGRSEIDSRELAKGLYHVRVVEDNKLITIEKWIRN